MEGLTVNVNVNIKSEGDAKSVEQAIFQYAMPALKDLRQKEKDKTITQEEKKEKDEILCMLFYLIKNYGYNIMNDMTKGCHLRYHDREELATMIKLAFMEHIYDYDPHKSTPTTYFKHYFIEAVRNYLQFCMGINQYYYTNMKKVRNVLNRYSQTDSKCDPEIISRLTGLSPKVVKKTLEMMEYHKVGIDEVFDISSNNITPEETVLEKEKLLRLNKILKDALSPLEEKHMLLRLNLDGVRLRTYGEIAEAMGSSVQDVSFILKNAQKKLRSDQNLKDFLGAYYSHYVDENQNHEKDNLFSEDISSIVCNFLID